MRRIPLGAKKKLKRKKENYQIIPKALSDMLTEIKMIRFQLHE